ncbi:MAG TPA: AAA family ATPase, partial [Rhodothermales bacterium]
MLRTLYIRDYALIEELEVSFGSGLNVITGETGAGKSILIGALKMILGERASTDVVRAGAQKAIIEGTFDHVDSERVVSLLRENQLDVSDHIILRREITTSASRAFINDSPATVTLMRDVASELIDLHGQHEHQSLLRTETHVGLIDSFGNLAPLVSAYRERLAAVRDLHAERDRLVAREQELARQKELYEFQIEEIDRVNPQADEEEALEQERRILENAE